VSRSRAEIKLAMRKASFASRSEAARYAASIRWKGNVKEENDPDNPVTEAGKEAMRLASGLAGFDEATNSIPRGVKTPVFYWSQAFGNTKDSEFGSEEEARAFIAEQKLLDPEGVLYIWQGSQKPRAELVSKFPNGVWTVMDAQLTLGYINNNVRPVDPSKPHSWDDIKYVTPSKIYGINPETNEIDDRNTIVVGDAEGQKADAMVKNTSPKNPAGLDRAGLVYWERSNMVKFTGYGEQNYCSSLGYYASMHAGYGQPYPRPDNSYRVVHKVREGKLMDLAQNLVDSLRNAPNAQPTLWRGIGASHQTEIKNAGKVTKDSEVGDTFTVGLGATSRSIAAARFYATPYSYNTNEDGIPTLMRIKAGSKGLALSSKMSAYPHDQEVLTSGEFRIVGKEVVNLSQKARRVAEQRMRIADVQKLPSGTRGKTDLLAREQEALKDVLESRDRELFTIIDVEQVSV
jgi:hypothetical protein